jgi:hypothetical protein
MDKESDTGMVIPLGITCSSARNSPEEYLFFLELTAHEQGIRHWKRILLAITCSLTKSMYAPADEWEIITAHGR